MLHKASHPPQSCDELRPSSLETEAGLRALGLPKPSFLWMYILHPLYPHTTVTPVFSATLKNFSKCDSNMFHLAETTHSMTSSALFISYILLGALLAQQEMASTVKSQTMAFLFAWLTATSHLLHAAKAASKGWALPLGLCQGVFIPPVPRIPIFTGNSSLLSWRPLFLCQVYLMDSACGLKSN